MDFLHNNLQNVLSRIRTVCLQSDRAENAASLIAVSKTFPAEDIRTVYRCGQRDFGENYIQEWYAKTDELADCPDIVWHIIGDIQSNKTKYVAERAHWVHTVSRLKIAERLSHQRPTHMPPLQICIEVNIAQKPNKHGIAPEDVLPLARELIKLPKLALRGLMCVAKADCSETELNRQFQTMRNLLAELNQAGIAADVLSMGMSSDMETAIRNGATHVRIGSAIFGNRQYAQST